MKETNPLIALTAKFGPILKAAFPDEHSVTRFQVANALAEAALAPQPAAAPDDVVERVARAMWGASHLQAWGDEQRPGAAGITEFDRQTYRDHARAAIAAMPTPSGALLDEAVEKVAAGLSEALQRIAESSANPDDPAYLTASALRIIASDALQASKGEG